MVEVEHANEASCNALFDEMKVKLARPKLERNDGRSI